MRVSAVARSREVDLSPLLPLSIPSDSAGIGAVSIHFFDDIGNLEAACLTPNVDRILSLIKGRKRQELEHCDSSKGNIDYDKSTIDNNTMEEEGGTMVHHGGPAIAPTDNPWDGSYANTAPLGSRSSGTDVVEKIAFTDSFDSYESCIEINENGAEIAEDYIHINDKKNINTSIQESDSSREETCSVVDRTATMNDGQPGEMEAKELSPMLALAVRNVMAGKRIFKRNR